MDSEQAAQFRAIRARRPSTWSAALKRALWSAVQSTLYRRSFHTANRWRAWLLRLFGAKVAPGCTIRRTSSVYYPWLFEMGAVSALGDHVVIYNLGRIALGSRVVISQEAYLCAGTHDYRLASMPLLTPPITVNDDAWICARAFICPGVTIGQGAIVGAAAVASHDVPDWTIVAGNPAKFIKMRDRPQ
jgi:putative colanic acid biosynthesis acetyltransferase WcaF